MANNDVVKQIREAAVFIGRKQLSPHSSSLKKLQKAKRIMAGLRPLHFPKPKPSESPP